MVMAAVSLIAEHGGRLDERTVREGLEGNLCRCTGYHNIVNAVKAASEKIYGAEAEQPVRGPVHTPIGVPIVQ
jgi:carbon-monoxide dehydrogenase small subunit